MSRGNPLINGTIVNPTSGIREPSVDQRLNEVEKKLAPLGSIEMAGQGERVLQGRNTVIPGGTDGATDSTNSTNSTNSTGPAEPAGSGLPSGFAEETLDVVNNNNTAGQRVFLTKAV